MINNYLIISKLLFTLSEMEGVQNTTINYVDLINYHRRTVTVLQ